MFLTNAHAQSVICTQLLAGKLTNQVGQPVCKNIVLHRHVCIVSWPNPPIAILELPIVYVQMANFPKTFVLVR